MGQDFGQFNLGPDRPQKTKINAKPLLAVLGVIVAIGVLGAIVAAFYYYYLLPQTRQASQSVVDQQNAAATATANMMTQEVNISIWSTATARAWATKTPATTVTPQASKTPTVGTQDPRTATVAVLMTQAAGARMTATQMGTATVLPDTGFADDVGLPGIVSMSLVLIVVILLVRRLRISNQS